MLNVYSGHRVHASHSHPFELLFDYSDGESILFVRAIFICRTEWRKKKFSRFRSSTSFPRSFIEYVNSRYCMVYGSAYDPVLFSSHSAHRWKASKWTYYIGIPGKNTSIDIWLLLSHRFSSHVPFSIFDKPPSSSPLTRFVARRNKHNQDRRAHYLQLHLCTYNSQKQWRKLLWKRKSSDAIKMRKVFVSFYQEIRRVPVHQCVLCTMWLCQIPEIVAEFAIATY